MRGHGGIFSCNSSRIKLAYCSTMLDFYGLGAGYPGTHAPEHLSGTERVKRIEDAVKAGISALIPGFRPDKRFIPVYPTARI